jgi:hypothetical protein
MSGLRTGAPWADLPKRYGAVDTVSWRFYRRRQASVFNQMLRCLQADARGELDCNLHFVDATVVYSRDGFSSKLQCGPVAAVLTSGERHGQFALDALMDKETVPNSGRGRLRLRQAGRPGTGSTLVHQPVIALGTTGLSQPFQLTKTNCVSPAPTKPFTGNLTRWNDLSDHSSSIVA